MTDITTALLKERILEILQIGANIKKAGTGTLRQGNTADAPYAIVETGAAEYSYPSNDVRDRVRDFSITVFVQPVNSGAEMEAEDACDPFFDLIPDLFDKRPSLTRYNTGTSRDELPLNNVKQAYLISDGGYATVRFGQIAWACAAGFVLRVELEFNRNQEV